MGKRRRYFSTIAISAAALVCYFPAAFYLKTSYSNDQPAGLRPLAICRTGVPHIYAASIWLPDTVDSVNIYENGTMIGKSAPSIFTPNVPTLSTASTGRSSVQARLRSGRQ